jgi:hypothetical protein
MPTRSLLNSVCNKITTAVRNDPKRAGVLTVLVVILAVLQIRLAMKRGAEEAMAASSVSSPGNKSNNGTSSASASAAPARAGASSATLRGWMESPPAVLTRNLFAIDLDYYAADNARPLAANNGANEGFWDELEKSMSSRADHRKERQIFIENLQRQAAEMRLQSTVMGAKPKAVIDGALVGEGDVVAQFRVLKIEPRRITVEREGIKLEIQMK